MPRSSAEMPPDLRRRLEDARVEFKMLDAREITDEIAGEMLALLLATFDQWPYQDPEVPSIDHLRWKMSGPATSLASMQGRVGSALVYTSTGFSGWMRIDGARRLRVVLVDICMAKEYQGRGLFSLSAAVRPYLAGYAGDLSLHEKSQTSRNVSALARKGQTLLANPVTALFRILRPRAWSVHRHRWVEAPITVGAWALGALRTAMRRSPSGTLVPTGIHDFDARFDVLFEEAARDFDVISERTGEYLRWRYGDRRAGPFVARAIADGDRLFGYAVLRTGRPRAHLADLLALPGRLDVIDALVADSVEIAREAGAAGIECWLPRRHPYRPALRRQGFFDSRHDTGVQYHAVDAPASALRALQEPSARVHYTLGDTDVI